MLGMARAVSLPVVAIGLTVAAAAGNINADVVGVPPISDGSPEHPVSQMGRILNPNRPAMTNRKFGRWENALPKPWLLGFSATFGPRQLKPTSEAIGNEISRHAILQALAAPGMEDSQVINLCFARQAP